MKLNQATTTAVAFLSTATATATATATLASSSSLGELKDKIAPLLTSRPNRYLLRNRMLQSSDACLADYFNNFLPTYINKLFYDHKCVSETQAGDTTFVFDYSPCAMYPLETCDAYNGTLVLRDISGDISLDCNVLNGENKGQSFKYIEKSFPWCFESCLTESEWDDEFAEGFEKEYGKMYSTYVNVADDVDVECKVSNSAGEDTDATDEPSSVGTSAGSNSAGEDTGLKLGDWAFCTSSNQCNNQCCSSKYSTSDGRLKCTPVGGFKPLEGCVGDSAPVPAPSNSNSVSASVTAGSSAGEDTGAVARPEIWVIVLCVTLALAVVGLCGPLCALGVKRLRQKNGKNAAVGGGKVFVSPHAAAAPTVMAAEDQLPTVYALPEENVITAVPPPQAYAYVATSAPPPTVNVTAEPYDSKYGY